MIMTTRNLAHLYSDLDDPRIDLEQGRIEAHIDSFVQKRTGRNDYLREEHVLTEAVHEYNELAERSMEGGRPMYYFRLRSQIESDNAEVQAKLNKRSAFAKEQTNKIQFFELRLAKVEATQQEHFLAAESLQPFKHFLKRIRERARHDLSEGEEKISNLLSKTGYSNRYNMISKLLSKQSRTLDLPEWKAQTKTFEEIYSQLTIHEDPQIRKIAEELLAEIYGMHGDIAEIELNSILEYKDIYDKLRGFSEQDSSRHLWDDIDWSVVKALTQSVQECYSISQDFFKFKAKLLGKEKLSYHERNREYKTKEAEYSYEQAVDLVTQSFNNLDPFFASEFTQLVTNGYVDAYPRSGKRGGAFCSYGLKQDPIYIMMNYTNKYNDVSTLAHEAGHALNDICIAHSQYALHFWTPLSTAEVASTFMENVLFDHVITTVQDPNVKFGMLLQKCERDISTIIRQIACYQFETDLHTKWREQWYLGKEEISELFVKNMKAYMGDTIEFVPGSELSRISWSHIRSYFYVYSYASGLLIANAMFAKRKQDPSFIQQIKEFYSAWLSKAPVEIFADMGIDISKRIFRNEGCKQLEHNVNEMIALGEQLGLV